MPTIKQSIRFIVDNSDEELLGLRMEMFITNIVRILVAVYVAGQITQEKVSVVLGYFKDVTNTDILTRLGEAFVYTSPTNG